MPTVASCPISIGQDRRHSVAISVRIGFGERVCVAVVYMIGA
jgi:hypothetical protein